MVAGSSHGEYGRMPINVDVSSKLFENEESKAQTVWMSHGDEVKSMPAGFKTIAKSESVRLIYPTNFLKLILQSI